MVLFVDHDADAARQVDSRACSDRLLVQASELLADQMPLVKEKSVFGRQLVHPHEHPVFDRAEARERFTDLRKNSQPLAVPRSRGKGVALEISRQPDSGRDDYVRMLARCIEPARATVGKK